MKGFYLFFLLLTLTYCSKFSLEEKQAVDRIFKENQKVQEILVANPNKFPDITPLLEVLKSAKSIIKNPDIIIRLDDSIKILTEIKTDERNSYFTGLSLFSEKLATFLDIPEDSGYHLFYCPMEKKHWVARGNSVKNPYAFDMQGCGELVK